jgi:hypothetical protein
LFANLTNFDQANKILLRFWCKLDWSVPAFMVQVADRNLKYSIYIAYLSGSLRGVTGFETVVLLVVYLKNNIKSYT